MDNNELRVKMLEKYESLKSWRKVGQEYGISARLAYRFVDEGYNPKNSEVRKKLGLPLYHLVPVRVRKPDNELTLAERRSKVLRRIKRAAADAEKIGMEIKWSVKL